LVYVGPAGTVVHDGHACAMIPEAISGPGTLCLYVDRTCMVAGRHEAVRPRKLVPHEGSTLALHRAPLVTVVSRRRYLKRQQRESRLCAT
jgi:hypothetical protein